MYLIINVYIKLNVYVFKLKLKDFEDICKIGLKNMNDRKW